MATIGIEGMEFFARHGVYEAEHALGAKYEVDLYLEVDLTAAAASDRLQDTVSYETIYALTAEQLNRPRKLLETLSHQLAVAILASEDRLSAVRVRVSKYAPPVGGLCRRAYVEFALGRS